VIPITSIAVKLEALDSGTILTRYRVYLSIAVL